MPEKAPLVLERDPDRDVSTLDNSLIEETQIYAKIINEELDKAMEVFN